MRIREKNKIRNLKIIDIDKDGIDSVFFDINRLFRIYSFQGLVKGFEFSKLGLSTTKEGLLKLKALLLKVRNSVNAARKLSSKKNEKYFIKIICSINNIQKDINQTLIYEYEPIKLFNGKHNSLAFKEKAIKTLISFHLNPAQSREWANIIVEEWNALQQKFKNDTDSPKLMAIELNGGFFTSTLNELYLKDTAIKEIFNSNLSFPDDVRFNNICRELSIEVNKSLNEKWLKIYHEISDDKFKRPSLNNKNGKDSDYFFGSYTENEYEDDYDENEDDYNELDEENDDEDMEY